MSTMFSYSVIRHKQQIMIGTNTLNVKAKWMMRPRAYSSWYGRFSLSSWNHLVLAATSHLAVNAIIRREARTLFCEWRKSRFRSFRLSLSILENESKIHILKWKAAGRTLLKMWDWRNQLGLDLGLEATEADTRMAEITRSRKQGCAIDILGRPNRTAFVVFWRLLRARNVLYCWHSSRFLKTSGQLQVDQNTPFVNNNSISGRQMQNISTYQQSDSRNFRPSQQSSTRRVLGAT